jgi:hypothetical protein
VQLHGARNDLEASGLGLVLIGQATPRHASHFRRTTGIDLPVLADEARVSYAAAGAKVATLGELLGPKVVGRGIAASRSSKVRQGRTIGNPAQLGGAMIVAPDGRVAWSHMSQDASDNATPQEIIAAAAQLAGAHPHG